MTWTKLPQLVHPPIEWLGYYFLRDKQTEWGVDIGTRLPGPDEDQTVLHTGFLRTEAGGGIPVMEGLMFELDLIMHGYWGYNADAAKSLSQRATLYSGGEHIRDQVVLCPLAEDGPLLPWTIHTARVSQEPHRQTDPMVNLIRYRSMVTWTVVGREA